MIRPGNADLTDEHLQNFACIEQFDELYGDEDEEDIKRLHADDNGEAEEDEEDEENEMKLMRKRRERKMRGRQMMLRGCWGGE